MYTVHISFDILSVEEGKSENWLHFTALIDNLDKNYKYTFDFCGTDVIHDIPVTKKVSNRLKEQLKKDFGNSPYDIEKCKEILGEGKHYLIPSK